MYHFATASSAAVDKAAAAKQSAPMAFARKNALQNQNRLLAAWARMAGPN